MYPHNRHFSGYIVGSSGAEGIRFLPHKFANISSRSPLRALPGDRISPTAACAKNAALGQLPFSCECTCLLHLAARRFCGQ